VKRSGFALSSGFFRPDPEKLIRQRASCIGGTGRLRKQSFLLFLKKIKKSSYFEIDIIP
jgi:hypothetical protein